MAKDALGSYFTIYSYSGHVFVSPDQFLLPQLALQCAPKIDGTHDRLPLGQNSDGNTTYCCYINFFFVIQILLYKLKINLYIATSAVISDCLQ